MKIEDIKNESFRSFLNQNCFELDKFKIVNNAEFYLELEDIYKSILRIHQLGAFLFVFIDEDLYKVYTLKECMTYNHKKEFLWIELPEMV